MIDTLAHDLNPWWRDPSMRASRHPFRRAPFTELTARIGTRDRAVAVVGLRQVGKTVLLRQLVDWARFEADPPLPAANVTYFDFQDDRAVGRISPREVLAIEPPGFRPDVPRLVLFDEIASFTGWDVWLKTVVDRQRHDPRVGRTHFVVSDSSASLLRAGGVESGLGRFDEVLVEPLSFAEFLDLRYGTERPLRERFAERPESFETFLLTGGFPEVALSMDQDPAGIRRLIREDMAGRAIEKDLIRYGLDARARDLFVTLAQRSGSLLGLEARARDLDATVNTVKRWLGVLEQAGLVVPLQRWTPGSKSAATSWRHTKLYVADHGMVSAFAALPDPLSSAEVRGAIYETLVFRTLREVARDQAGRLRFGRWQDGLEVDFILEAGSARTAIEVTSAPSPRGAKVERLARAATRVQADRTLLLHGGVTTQRESAGCVLPMHEFLLDPSKSLESLA